VGWANQSSIRSPVGTAREDRIHPFALVRKEWKNTNRAAPANVKRRHSPRQRRSFRLTQQWRLGPGLYPPPPAPAKPKPAAKSASGTAPALTLRRPGRTQLLALRAIPPGIHASPMERRSCETGNPGEIGVLGGNPRLGGVRRSQV
jgi:hypothetical protein